MIINCKVENDNHLISNSTLYINLSVNYPVLYLFINKKYFSSSLIILNG